MFDKSCSCCGDIAPTPDDLADGEICHRCYSEFRAQIEDVPISQMDLVPRHISAEL